ncbi:hypothetical protein ScPMuIL_014445 [Solemya velum]
MSNVKVAVRVRPLSQKEKDKNAGVIVDVHGDNVAIINPKVDGIAEFADSREKVKHFTFDYCYDSTLDVTAAGYASQQLVFQDLGTEVLQAAFEGYNACVFAYGQTSTGKTHTMMGYPGEVGLIPRICEGLFSHVDDCVDRSASFRVDISYLEIYNERVRDLLCPADGKQTDKYTLKVREHPKDGPYVQDLSQHLVKDNSEIQMLLERGNDARTTAATYMHDHSSRSHAIVTVSFTQAKLEDDMPSEKVSKIHMVDLAGSERADPNFSPEYKGRLKEGANINKSLVTLGNVIKALAERSVLSSSSENLGSEQNLTGETTLVQGTTPRSSSLYVPYRDSVLTWLLKDSLGGNSKTLMIATVTSASVYYRESLSTLRYAQRAKSIVNQPKINEDSNVTLIRELRREIEQLRGMLMSAQRVGTFVSVQDTGTLIEEKLHDSEAKANQLTRSWMEKWTETHEIMKDSDLSIRGLGNRVSSMGVLIDSQLPHLIGMDDDILSTGVTMYYLKEGKTLIGTEDASRQQDIVLSGPMILKEHCFIKNYMGTVTLHPNRGAKCALNGIDIRDPSILSQGDYILLGKVNMFRFNNPAEAAKLREHRKVCEHSLIQIISMALGDQSVYSSSSSLADEGTISYASQLPHFRIFNTNLELEKTCVTEQEKIEQARKVLRGLGREHRLIEHLQEERESEMWKQRQEGLAEVDMEEQKLHRLIETTQQWKATEDQKIQETRKKIMERWAACKLRLCDDGSREFMYRVRLCDDGSREFMYHVRLCDDGSRGFMYCVRLCDGGSRGFMYRVRLCDDGSREFMYHVRLCDDGSRGFMYHVRLCDGGSRGFMYRVRLCDDGNRGFMYRVRLCDDGSREFMYRVRLCDDGSREFMYHVRLCDGGSRGFMYRLRLCDDGNREFMYRVRLCDDGSRGFMYRVRLCDVGVEGSCTM